MNNLPPPFPHLGGAPTGGIDWRLAMFARQSSNLAGVCVVGWRSSYSLTTEWPTCPDGSVGLKWDSWLEAGSGVLLFRSNQMKTMVLGSGGHGVHPWPTCPKASIMPCVAD